MDKLVKSIVEVVKSSELLVSSVKLNQENLDSEMKEFKETMHEPVSENDEDNMPSSLVIVACSVEMVRESIEKVEALQQLQSADKAKAPHIVNVDSAIMGINKGMEKILEQMEALDLKKLCKATDEFSEKVEVLTLSAKELHKQTKAPVSAEMTLG